jgi:hypothetical protein
MGFNQELSDEPSHGIAIIGEHYSLLWRRGDFQFFLVGCLAGVPNCRAN